MTDEAHPVAPPRDVSRVVVFGLGFVLPGLGHVYAGCVQRGAVVFALRLLVGGLLQLPLLFFATGPAMATMAVVATIPMNVVSASDGVRFVRGRQHVWEPPRRVAVVVGSAVLGSLLAVLAVGWLGILLSLAPIRSSFVSLVQVPSGAMQPTLVIGDYVLLDRRPWAMRDLAAGDVLVFRYPPEPEIEYVKRLAGLPGQTVAVTDGCLVVDGVDRCRPGGVDEAVDEAVEEFIEEVGGRAYRVRRRAGMRDFGPVVVPEDRLFVLGDNRPESADSRRWGFVPVDDVTGKMLRVALSVPVEFRDFEERRAWTKVRWHRIGKTAFEE